MIRVWLSPPAIADLREIAAYIRRENPKAAQSVAAAIYASCMELNIFPHRGRASRIAGMRELVVPSLPYVIVYRLSGDFVEISRVFHMAREF